MLSKEDITHKLPTSIVGKKVFVFDTIDSTNSCARALGDADADEGAVVIAEYQSSGRGRLGRSWLAEPGTSLLLSVLLRPPCNAETAGLLTIYTSAAIAIAIERSARNAVECKWPNDLLLGGRKFCGILIENSFQQSGLSYSVIGAGINVNQTTFPPEIAEKSTSLARDTGKTVDRVLVLREVLIELDRMYKAVRQGDFNVAIAEWTKRCSMFGKPITVEEHEQTVRGIAVRLRDDGGLVISSGSGERTIYSGDVTVVG
jgi:BirA family biotin operon repressor/biotin-[acetyl-CoA-carboxylase] ligase